MASIFDKNRAAETVASAPVASAPVASAPVASAPVASAPVASAPVASAPVASAPVASATTAENVETRKLSERDANGLSIKNASTREKDAEKRALLEELCSIVKSAVEAGKLGNRALEIAQKLRPTYFGLSNVPDQFKAKDTTKQQDLLLSVLGKNALAEIKVGDTFTELDAFQKIKAGRKETREICNALIREPKKFQPIWILFDEKTAVYTVKAIGDKPADWSGYVPFKR